MHKYVPVAFTINSLQEIMKDEPVANSEIAKILLSKINQQKKPHLKQQRGERHFPSIIVARDAYDTT